MTVFLPIFFSSAHGWNADMIPEAEAGEADLIDHEREADRATAFGHILGQRCTTSSTISTPTVAIFNPLLFWSLVREIIKILAHLKIWN